MCLVLYLCYGVQADRGSFCALIVLCLSHILYAFLFFMCLYHAVCLKNLYRSAGGSLLLFVLS